MEMQTIKNEKCSSTDKTFPCFCYIKKKEKKKKKYIRRQKECTSISFDKKRT